MLKELRVRDLALVEQATVRFQGGLNLLTGETGSGKSLLVDALGLALGGRSGADQVRHGARKALVEAVFEVAGSEVVLTREVGRRGGARLDGRAATPAQLREQGRTLVAVHGQHEHQALLDPEAQTLLLDAYGAGLALRERMAAAYGEWKQSGTALAELERLQARGQREQEYLRWQLEELRAASLRPGEDDELAAERSAVRHSARLADLSGQALEALRADAGLPTAAASLRTAAELDPRLSDLSARLQALEDEVAESAAGLRRYAEGLDADPARLEAIEGRLALLDGLKRKYGGSLESALAERDRLEAQLGAGEDLETALAAASARLRAASADLSAAAAELSQVRATTARRLGEAVAGELDGLRLEGARFEVQMVPRPELQAQGAEWAEMMFSANPGEPLLPLARVASGGELARVMLAVKSVGAEADAMPTLVFDEVDSGIGGEAALQVGLRLKALGARRQVLVVTHLAQIACFADHHLLVEKSLHEGRNRVAVRELNGREDRARELARMMGGAVTEKALARARELLHESSLPSGEGREGT